MNGQTFPIGNNAYTHLYSLIFCNFGCAPHEFSGPTADGPLSKLSGTPAVPGALTWQITTEGLYPMGKPDDVYAGEVLFTTAMYGGAANRFASSGFTPVDLGSLITHDIVAYKVPSTWPDPSYINLGELHLFLTSTPLPAGLTPADGHKVDLNSGLGWLLYYNGYPLDGHSLAVPRLENIGDFRWAIAETGAWPEQ